MPAGWRMEGGECEQGGSSKTKLRGGHLSFDRSGNGKASDLRKVASKPVNQLYWVTS